MTERVGTITVVLVGVALAPFVVAALASLALQAFSVVVRPVSISFRLFGMVYRGDSVLGRFSTSLLSLHPLLAISILVAATALFAAVLRATR